MKKRMNVLKFTLGLSVFLLVGVKAAVAGQCPSGSCYCPTLGHCIDTGANCPESAVKKLANPSKDILYVFEEETYFTCESSEGEPGQDLHNSAFVKTPQGYYICSHKSVSSLPKESLKSQTVPGKKGTVYAIPAGVPFKCAGSLKPQEVISCDNKSILMCSSSSPRDDKKTKKERR